MLDLSQLKLIVGLGNPGTEYEFTRHNAGFSFLDFLADQTSGVNFSLQKKFFAQLADFKLAPANLKLVKPQTFMNLSGQSVAALVNFYQLRPETELLVVFDDLDLSLDEFKLQFAKGPHGHNGLESIYGQLGTKDFWHLRLGIDDRLPQQRLAQSPADYVLGKFTADQAARLRRVFALAFDQITNQT